MTIDRKFFEVASETYAEMLDCVVHVFGKVVVFNLVFSPKTTCEFRSGDPPDLVSTNMRDKGLKLVQAALIKCQFQSTRKIKVN